MRKQPAKVRRLFILNINLLFCNNKYNTLKRLKYFKKTQKIDHSHQPNHLHRQIQEETSHKMLLKFISNCNHNNSEKYHNM